MKFLRILLIIKTQTMQDLYIENYKMLQKVIKESQKMQEYTMFVQKKTQHCYDVRSSQISLWI